MQPVQKTLRISPLVYLHEQGTPQPPGLPPAAIALAQVPSRAFGDGSHPTTGLCAGALDFLCRQRKPSAVLDVGTGTGVLARIARSRGAAFVVGTDIDPEALDAARANAKLDLTAGTSGSILFSSDPPHTWGPRFDLVVANILEAPLRELAPLFRQALSPEGTLLISGFTPLQIPMIETAFRKAGLMRVNQAATQGWALLEFRASAEVP